MSHIWNIETSGVILTHQVAHTLGLTHDSSSMYLEVWYSGPPYDLVYMAKVALIVNSY